MKIDDSINVFALILSSIIINDSPDTIAYADALVSFVIDWQSPKGPITFRLNPVLENIRVNSVLMSNQHKKRYLYLKYLLNYFRLPVIVVSGLNSVFSVGLQPYMKQDIISVMTCLLSLICGIIGSIELFLAIQTQMENELLTSKDYYLLSIDIFKMNK